MPLPAPFQTHTPEELSKLIDNLWKAEQKLKAAELKLKPIKDTIAALEAEVQAALLAGNIEAQSTKSATAALKRTEYAELTDDKAFFAYVGRTKSWDLVRKQPVVSACRERWNDNVKIPGVVSGTRVSLSLTARKK